MSNTATAIALQRELEATEEVLVNTERRARHYATALRLQRERLSQLKAKLAVERARK